MSNITSNVISIEVGGKTLTLRYNMGALQHLGKIAKVDPMEGLSPMESEFKNLCNLVEAGLVGNSIHNDEDYQPDSALIARLVGKMEVSQSRDISKVFTNSYADPEAPAAGEGSGDTQR